MKFIHQFFARLFSNKIENPKIKFTSTDSVKEKLYFNSRRYHSRFRCDVWGQLFRVANVEAWSEMRFHIFDKVFQQISPLQDKIHEKSKKRLSE